MKGREPSNRQERKKCYALLLPERLDTEIAIIEGRSDKCGDSKLQKVRKTFC